MLTEHPVFSFMGDVHLVFVPCHSGLTTTKDVTNIYTLAVLDRFTWGGEGAASSFGRSHSNTHIFANLVSFSACPGMFYACHPNNIA